ncbi:sensor histidine kinase [Pseudonocardia nigra]|uniref:sensor histidine kinase n=1 Tax=Pseudonocardia nigra TaxID=1921578 RepID=UPI0027E286D1|nr:sensor histidine kinase [Pseudonocardia nigra]
MEALQVVRRPAAVRHAVRDPAVRWLAEAVWWAAGGVSAALFLVSLPSAYTAVAELRGFGSFGDGMTPAEAAGAFAALGVAPAAYAAVQIGVILLVTAVWWGVGVAIHLRRPRDRGAWLISLTLVTWAAFFPNTVDTAGAPPAVRVVADVLGTAAFAGFFLLVYLFPDGRFVPGWTRWVAPVFVAELVLNEHFPASALNERPLWVDLPLYAVLLGALFVAPVVRYRRAGPVQRRQLKWALLGIGTAMVAFVGLGTLAELVPQLTAPGVPALLYEFAGIGLLELAFLAVPVTIGIAVLRHQLFDIDLVLSRTLGYAALTVAVVAIYVLVVGGIGALVPGRGTTVLSLFATGLVAVLVIPLRTRLQRAVNRLVHGDRDDPYAVLSRLGARLEAGAAREDVLAVVVETLASALKLPYVAIETTGAAGASRGSPGERVLRFPLTHGAERVGDLVASPRRGEDGFGPADRRLLEDLARQAGTAAHAVLLADDLRRARERLVTAREEERRRLRRDLHDGLGPQLSSQALTIDAIRTLLRRDPDAAEELLLDLKAQAQQAVTDVRRVVHGLRPPALDDLGLLGALTETAGRHRADGLDVTVDAPAALPPLSAAVEVAAYRIAQEALTNVVRHARARTCVLRLAPAPGALVVEIRDDGCGIGAIRGVGVGLGSMRERAVELGGRLDVGPAPGGGTLVRAELPVGDDR